MNDEWAVIESARAEAAAMRQVVEQADGPAQVGMSTDQFRRLAQMLELLGSMAEGARWADGPETGIRAWVPVAALNRERDLSRKLLAERRILAFQMCAAQMRQASATSSLATP
jgi:hypothetical protein